MRRPDNLRPGLLTRDGVTPGAPIAFFNYRHWVDQKYATVEHVAPDAGAPSEWDMKHLYRKYYQAQDRQPSSTSGEGKSKYRQCSVG